MADPVIDMHVLDSGTRLRFHFKNQDKNRIDISNPETLTATVEKPNDTKFTRNLSIEAAVSGIAFFDSTDEFSEGGNYRAQGTLEKLGKKHKSNIIRFRVRDNL